MRASSSLQLGRRRPHSSPQRIPVYAAVMTSIWFGQERRPAISLTWTAVAHGRSGRWPEVLRSPPAGVHRDASFFDGLTHDHGEQAEDAGDGGVGAAGVEVFGPAFDGHPGDRVERAVAEAGQDVDVEVGAVALEG